MNEPVGIKEVLAEFTRRFAPNFPPVDGKINFSGGVESRHAATVSTTEVNETGVVNGPRARSYSEINNSIVGSGSSAPPAEFISETPLPPDQTPKGDRRP